MHPSIIIADDHPLILKGLGDFLQEKGFPVTSTAEDGIEAYEQILKHKPDIAILDIRMPNMTGIEVARQCDRRKLNTRIILITFERGIQLYQEAKSLNVYGYILKEFALEEIENCIRAVQDNEVYFSPAIENFMKEQMEALDYSFLTPTEKKVLKLIARNRTAKEIGDELCISNRTVEKHKSHIIKKLNIEPTQNSLLIWAKENQNTFM